MLDLRVIRNGDRCRVLNIALFGLGIVESLFSASLLKQNRFAAGIRGTRSSPPVVHEMLRGVLEPRLNFR